MMTFTLYAGADCSPVANIRAEDVLAAAVEVGRAFPGLAGETQALTTGEGGHEEVAVVMADGQRHLIRGAEDDVAGEVRRIVGEGGGHCLIAARGMAMFSYAPPADALDGLRAALRPVLG